MLFLHKEIHLNHNSNMIYENMRDHANHLYCMTNVLPSNWSRDG